jgi:hypothetical protein
MISTPWSGLIAFFSRRDEKAKDRRRLLRQRNGYVESGQLIRALLFPLLVHDLDLDSALFRVLPLLAVCTHQAAGLGSVKASR